jgi:hypothetical protein
MLCLLLVAAEVQADLLVLVDLAVEILVEQEAVLQEELK